MEQVNHPSHYNQGKIEVIEFIEDQLLGFNLGNAIKYIARAGKKDEKKTVEDLEKAIWYVRRHIELVTSAIENRSPVRPNDMNKKKPPGVSVHVSGPIPSGMEEKHRKMFPHDFNGA